MRFLCATLDSSFKSQLNRLDRMRKKRHQAVYRISGGVSETEDKATIDFANNFVTKVGDLILGVQIACPPPARSCLAVAGGSASPSGEAGGFKHPAPFTPLNSLDYLTGAGFFQIAKTIERFQRFQRLERKEASLLDLTPDPRPPTSHL